MWPFLRSRAMVMGIQQHQATPSLHSLASVMACESSTTDPLQLQPFISIGLRSSPASHGLLPPQGTQQAAHSLPEHYCFCNLQQKHLKTSQDIYLYFFEKKMGPCLLFFTFHIYDLLFRRLHFFVYVCLCLFLLYAEVELLQLSNKPLK